MLVCIYMQRGALEVRKLSYEIVIALCSTEYGIDLFVSPNLDPGRNHLRWTRRTDLFQR